MKLSGVRETSVIRGLRYAIAGAAKPRAVARRSAKNHYQPEKGIRLRIVAVGRIILLERQPFPVVANTPGGQETFPRTLTARFFGNALIEIQSQYGGHHTAREGDFKYYFGPI